MGSMDQAASVWEQESPQAGKRAFVSRAVEAAVWGLPAVNYELMRAVMAPDQVTTFVYWSTLLNWQNQTLTPNPDLIYYMAFLDPGREGPIVLEIPPSDDVSVLNGSVCNVWQAPLEDVGRFGADGGAGARYLILPPGYDGDVPDGYVALRSDTRRVYALLRCVLPEATQSALDAGLRFCSRIQAYSLSGAENPAPTPRRDLAGELVDTRIPYDERFWQALARVVQDEPWLERDRPFAEILSHIGITRDEPFTPNSQQQALLLEALEEAHAFVKELYENQPAFYEGTHWFFPAGRDFIAAQGANWSDTQVYPYTDRAVIYHMAFIGLKRLGVGQFYLVVVRDSNGEMLDSARSYRLRVPADVPVSQYWSVTMYDGEDHTFIRGNEKYSVSSLTPGLAVNEDGSVDVFFGPGAATGQEANWVETGESTSFELMFRFYGVQPAVLAKTWQLPDLNRITTDTDGSTR